MLYTEYWNLAFPPFADDNRPEAFVPTRGASLAIGRLRYALGTEMGASALFGGPGSGKTRVAKRIREEFAAAHWLSVYVPSPHGTARDLLASLDPTVAAGLDAASSGVAELRAFLANAAAGGRPTLLVVDDVQAARGSDFLELVRTLLNIDADGGKAVSLLLVGQPGMDRKLAAASGFDTRLAVRAVLEPMTADETRLYMLSRLKAAASRQGIFTRHAAERVVEISRGIPRQVNRLCEMALVIAFGLDMDRVTPDVIEMAAADLDLLPGADAPFFPWSHPEPEDAGGAEGGEGEDDTEDILASIPADSGDNS